jgi:isoleucyl-tRNA synthetase
MPFIQAVLVHPEVTYGLVVASVNGRESSYIIAKEQIDDLFLHKIKVNGYRVATTFLGKELKVLHALTRVKRRLTVNQGLQFNLPAFGNSTVITGPVLLATEVNSRYGSGLVPCAPSCGADDWVLAKLNNLAPCFSGLDEFGVIRYIKLGIFIFPNLEKSDNSSETIPRSKA